MSRITELHARLGLDVSAFVKGSASMSDSLKTAILKNQEALDKMDARFSRTFLGYVQGSTKAFSTYGIERLIAKFNALSEAQKKAFTEADTRAEQAAILNPDRGLGPAALARAQFNSAEFDTAQGSKIAQELAQRTQQRLAAEEVVRQARLAAEAEWEAVQTAAANRVAAMRKERADEQAAYEARAGVENITTRLAAIRKAHQESKRGPESLGAIASDVGDIFDEKQVAVQKSLVDGQRQLTGLVKQTDAAADSVAENLKRQANAILNQIDPQREMVALQARLNEMVAAGHLTAGQAQTFMSQQIRFQKGSLAASKYGLVLQQAGYQMQDFSVQVASGTNAMVAFSQQASQMLGFFGAGGAIAGAVVSTAILAYRLGSVSDNADKAAKQTRTLADALRDYNEQLDKSRRLRLGLGDEKSSDVLAQEAINASEAAKRAQQIVIGTNRAMRLADRGENPFSWLTDPVNAAAFRLVPVIFQSGMVEAHTDAITKNAEALAARNDYIKTAISLTESMMDAMAESVRGGAGGEGAARQIEDRQKWLNALVRESNEKREADNFRMAEGIKDQLDPMRERNRLQERLNELVGDGKTGMLSREEADRYLLNQAFKDLKAPQDLGSADSYARRGMVIGSGGHTTSRLEQTVTDEMKKISNSLTELLRTTKERL